MFDVTPQCIDARKSRQCTAVGSGSWSEFVAPRLLADAVVTGLRGNNTARGFITPEDAPRRLSRQLPDRPAFVVAICKAGCFDGGYDQFMQAANRETGFIWSSGSGPASCLLIETAMLAQACVRCHRRSPHCTSVGVVDLR
ncbi:hypothetical protein CIW53_15220 [Rhodanobacter sp. T12-5]|nr:hypothetical protein CIW53_15220 [Rhodanobacter sp. T12-5]